MTGPRAQAALGAAFRLLAAGDLLTLLYAIVVARQYLWLAPNGVAWALALVLAGLLAFLRLRSRPATEPLSLAFWLLVGAPIGVLWGLHLPLPDVGWDVLNYHLLHGERALRGLLAIPGDFYPYFFPYLNPAPDMVAGIFRFLLGYRLGTVGTGLALLWTGAILFRALGEALPSPRLRAAAVLGILLTEGLLWQVGSYMDDLWALPLLLQATLLAVPRDDGRDLLEDLPALGLLLGTSVALKLTNLAFAGAIGLAFLIRLAGGRVPRPGTGRAAARAALAAALFLLPLVPHTLLVWWTTGNPIFPHYNTLFRSPLFPPIDTKDARWGPHGLLEVLAWPLLSALRPDRLGELAASSGRVGLGVLAALTALAARPRDQTLRTLSLLLLGGALLWSASTGYERYGLYVDLLAGLVLVLLARAAFLAANTGRAARLAAPLLIALLAGSSLLALRLVDRSDWSGHPLAYRCGRAAASEIFRAGRDRDLARLLPGSVRAELATSGGWVDAAPKTNGLMALLAPERPILGLTHELLFDVAANRPRFDEALRAVQGRRLLSFAFSDDADAARSVLELRGFRILKAEPCGLGFFSSQTTLGLVAFTVEPPPATPGPTPTSLGMLLRRPGPAGASWHAFTGLLGSVDDPPEGAVVSGRLLVRGWARTPDEDLDVVIEIDGRRRTPESFRRTDRPDVSSVFPHLGDTSRAGWEATFAFTPGDSGPHQIVAVFRTLDGRFRRYPFRRITWKP